MAGKREVMEKIRALLTEVALELEDSAAGAKAAAESLPDARGAWPQFQRMYARLQHATFLVARFEQSVEEAIAAAARREPPR